MKHSPRRGYAFLLSVVVIGTAATAAAAALLLLSASAQNNLLISINRQRVQNDAEGCADRVIRTLRENPSFAGDMTMTLENGHTCRIGPIGGTGNTNRSLCITASYRLASVLLEIDIASVLPSTITRSWATVTSFSLCSP